MRFIWLLPTSSRLAVYLGARSKTVVADTAQNPDRAVGEARRLIEEEDVHAIVGPSTSVNALAVAERVAVTAGIPFISPAAGTARLTDAADNDFFFRATLSHRAYGPALARLAGERGFDNVGVLYRDDLWGEGLVQAFAQAWDGAIQSVPVGIGQTSVADALRESAAGGAQVLVVLLYPAEAVIAAREALDLGLYDQFLWNGALRNLDLIRSNRCGRVGRLLRRRSVRLRSARSGTGWRPMPRPTASLRSAATPVRSTTPPLPLPWRPRRATAQTAPSFAIICEASFQVLASPSPPDRTAWRARIEVLADGGQIVYQGASGPLEWDANGDLRQGYVAVWRYAADGRIEHVRRILHES